MQKKNKIIVAATIATILTGGIVWASDHTDAPAITGTSEDITDLYAFQGANPSNLVFILNSQGLLSPSATATAAFDPNTLLEINIDNNGDNVEDLVIEAIYDGTNINFYGPVKPSSTGLKSVLEGPITAKVAVTPYSATSPTVATGSNGMMVFAGPRDDPFFFDLNQYHKILAGTATGFNNPGIDAFAGTNVLSLVVEVPKSLLGTPTGGKFNVWAQTKKKL